MNISISEKSKKAYEAAAKKLGITTQIPDLSILRPDLALYLTAKLMLAVIIEADKDGKIFDITNHDKRKYENVFYAEEGYKAGSSGGGFSFNDYDNDNDYSNVRAHLSKYFFAAQTLPLGKKSQKFLKGVGTARENDLLKLRHEKTQQFVRAHLQHRKPAPGLLQKGSRVHR